MKPQFSNLVLDDGNYTVVKPIKDDTVSRSSLDNGRVYFSFTLIGEDKAIQYIKDKGQLEVYAVIYAGGIRRDTISIGIDQEKWMQVSKSITDKYNRDGYFTWRTYMYTQQTNFSSVEILVRDGINTVITHSILHVIP